MRNLICSDVRGKYCNDNHRCTAPKVELMSEVINTVYHGYMDVHTCKTFEKSELCKQVDEFMEEMSMRDVIETIEHDAFAKVMNVPEDGFDGQAEVRTFTDGSRWVICPWCGKKALKILPETRIENLTMKCSGSNCKKYFDVTVR